MYRAALSLHRLSIRLATRGATLLKYARHDDAPGTGHRKGSVIKRSLDRLQATPKNDPPSTVRDFLGRKPAVSDCGKDYCPTG